MAYSQTRSPPDANGPGILEAPYSPPEAIMPHGDLEWLEKTKPTPALTPIQIALQHHRQMQAKSGETRKKNKLGYSRTPVACGPCRQRKIRCIPSTSDPHSSCENCRRLNKECTFIPTESQQGRDPAARERASRRAELMLGSHGSPPDLGVDSYVHHSSHPGYHTAIHHASPAWSNAPLSPTAISTDRDDISRHETTYITSGAPSYMHTTGVPSGADGWRGHQPDPTYQKYGQPSPPSATHGRPTVYPYDARWDGAPPPGRSLSYSSGSSVQSGIRPYERGQQPLPYQATDPQAVTTSVPMSSTYAPVIPSHLPTQSQMNGLIDGHQHGHFQDRHSCPIGWAYHHQRDHHDTA